MNTVNEDNAIDETISTTEVKKEESFLSVEVLSPKAVVGIKPSRLGGSFWYLEAVSFCRSVVRVEWLRGFRCLDACSLVGGAIWVGLGSVALLEELSVTHYSRFTLGFTTSCGSRCERSASSSIHHVFCLLPWCPCHYGSQHCGTLAQIQSFFYKLPRSWHFITATNRKGTKIIRWAWACNPSPPSLLSDEWDGRGVPPYPAEIYCLKVKLKE